MRYQCSRARRSFEEQVQLSVRELRPLYRIAQKAGGGGATRLLGAYYVFVFSQLEVYVKSFVEDLLGAINASSPTLDKFPDLMLGYFIHGNEKLGSHYRKYSTNDDEGALLQGVSKIVREVAVWGNGGAIPIAVDPSAFLEKKRYPSPRNIPQLFRRLGINQVWGVISAAGKMNSELILTSLNDLRTDVAHEGKVPPGFGMADFNGRIEQMSRFVAALDRGVSKYFCSQVMSRSVWNAQMV